MEKGVAIQLTGKWKKGVNKVNYTFKDIEAIKKDLIDGVLLSDIHVKHRVSREVIQLIFDDHIHVQHKVPVVEKQSYSTGIIGKKTLWDFKTEKEMFEEEPYTWESLSQAEIDFYYKYQRKNYGQIYNRLL
jgi:hypothetical protein